MQMVYNYFVLLCSDSRPIRRLQGMIKSWSPAFQQLRIYKNIAVCRAFSCGAAVLSRPKRYSPEWGQGQFLRIHWSAAAVEAEPAGNGIPVCFPLVWNPFDSSLFLSIFSSALFRALVFDTISWLKSLISIRKASPDGAARFVIYKERNHKTSLIWTPCPSGN